LFFLAVVADNQLSDSLLNYCLQPPLPTGMVIEYNAFNQRTATSTTNVSRRRRFKQSEEEFVQMAEGNIKKLTDRGFGFINTDNGKDLFFHSSSVQGAGFDALREGQKVSYTEGRGQKGPCAENVTIL
jgi:CspA family cold shock protein